MPKTLSLDLRTRVLSAVSGGMSHRAVAERFGVSAASVSRWRALAREHGSPVAKPRGGDRRSSRIEAEAELIFRLLRETPDITIEELRAELAARGHAFGYGSVRRFFTRHDITRKKRQRTQASRTGPTS